VSLARLTATNGMTLQRATAADRDAVEDLQHAAYTANREVLGVEPVPLLADYVAIFRHYEVWIKPGTAPNSGLDAALILEIERPPGFEDDILIWSVSTSPASQMLGLGHALLECAEQRARELGRRHIRLYTGQRLTHLVDWYRRNGYELERTEELADRTLVHMIKNLN
jgi:ribosomal protein S18 acetylase RimI-like enzyme